MTRAPGSAAAHPAPASATATSAFRGFAVGLHTTPRAMLPMRSVTSLELVAGHGVQEDRYSVDRGYLSKKLYDLNLREQRDVTFFEHESLTALERDFGLKVSPEDHRRNVTTFGVPLNHLIGRRFRLGEAVLDGFFMGPCQHLSDVVGQQITQLLVNRGGLQAAIVRGGTVRLGDEIVLADA